MSDLCSGQLKLYSNIPETEVDWLWYPYIPFGKLTVLNGDPGNGKSTLMMNIIAAASSGGFVPDGRKMKKPIHVIYQCSEDSAGDNPVFCFMDKKRAEGKHFYVYTVAGSAKFLRIYYAKVKEYLNALEETA